MASALRQLPDEALEAVHQMIRRDAMTDLEIAREAERLGGETMEGFSLGPTDAARAAVVYRYRRGSEYRAWKQHWLTRTEDLRRATELQKQRFELVSDLVRGADADGFERMSAALQARMLTLAAEADDGELKEAMKGRGWVANALGIVQATVSDRYRQKAEELKAQLRALVEAPESAGGVDMEQVISRVDKIMGIA